MDILYRSCDGVLYDDKDKCLQHEKELKDFIMFDEKWDEVYNPNKAYFIICPTDENAKRLFNYFIKSYKDNLPWTREEDAQKGIYAYSCYTDD